MLERIDRQVKTIETLFGEMHEGVVVINEPAINESENNDNDKADTSVLFYNDTASQLLKTKPKAADLEDQKQVETKRIKKIRKGRVLLELHSKCFVKHDLNISNSQRVHTTQNRSARESQVMADLEAESALEISKALL